MEEYLTLLEQENVRLLHRNEKLLNRNRLRIIQDNVKGLMERGSVLAPLVDVRPELAKNVDQVIRSSVLKSKDFVNLTHCNPSFCAWF